MQGLIDRWNFHSIFFNVHIFTQHVLHLLPSFSHSLLNTTPFRFRPNHRTTMSTHFRRTQERVNMLKQKTGMPVVIPKTDTPYVIRYTLETENVFSGRQRAEGCIHMTNDPLNLLTFVRS